MFVYSHMAENARSCPIVLYQQLFDTQILSVQTDIVVKMNSSNNLAIF